MRWDNVKKDLKLVLLDPYKIAQKEYNFELSVYTISSQDPSFLTSVIEIINTSQVFIYSIIDQYNRLNYVIYGHANGLILADGTNSRNICNSLINLISRKNKVYFLGNKTENIFEKMEIHIDSLSFQSELFASKEYLQFILQISKQSSFFSTLLEEHDEIISSGTDLTIYQALSLIIFPSITYLFLKNQSFFSNITRPPEFAYNGQNAYNAPQQIAEEYIEPNIHPQVNQAQFRNLMVPSPPTTQASPVIIPSVSQMNPYPQQHMIPGIPAGNIAPPPFIPGVPQQNIPIIPNSAQQNNIPTIASFQPNVHASPMPKPAPKISVIPGVPPTNIVKAEDINYLTQSNQVNAGPPVAQAVQPPYSMSNQPNLPKIPGVTRPNQQSQVYAPYAGKPQASAPISIPGVPFANLHPDIPSNNSEDLVNEFKCPVIDCNQIRETPKELFLHLYRYHQYPGFIAQQCKRQTDTRNEFVCCQCNKKLESYQLFLEHLYDFHYLDIIDKTLSYENRQGPAFSESIKSWLVEEKRKTNQNTYDF